MRCIEPHCGSEKLLTIECMAQGHRILGLSISCSEKTLANPSLLAELRQMSDELVDFWCLLQRLTICINEQSELNLKLLDILKIRGAEL